MKIEITQEEYNKYLEYKENQNKNIKFKFNVGDFVRIKGNKNDIFIIEWHYLNKEHIICKLKNKILNRYNIYYIIRNKNTGIKYTVLEKDISLYTLPTIYSSDKNYKKAIISKYTK